MHATCNKYVLDLNMTKNKNKTTLQAMLDPKIKQIVIKCVRYAVFTVVLESDVYHLY